MLQQPCQVRVCLQVVCLCCFDDSVNNSAGLCAFRCIDQDPVFSPDRKWPNGDLCRIIIQRHRWIIQEYTQVPFLIQGIGKSLPDGGECVNQITFATNPLEKVIYQWFDDLLRLLQIFIVRLNNVEKRHASFSRNDRLLAACRKGPN